MLIHPTILSISFTHNHPLQSAHALSFRPISKGHSASSAHHWHETKLFLDHGEDQTILADREINPTKPDFYRLYDEWRKKELGSDQGKPMFEQMNAEIAAYNDANSGNGGRAAMHIFKGAPSFSSESDPETDGDDALKQKRAKNLRESNQ